MPFNVLLLPLLGGYIFISNWNRTRFRALRLSGNKLILESAIAGMVLLVISFGITTIVSYSFEEVVPVWNKFVPFDYAGPSSLAFLLGALLWWPLNRIYKRDVQNRRAILESNDFLEILLERALRESKQISITMKSSKVYIGFISKMFDPSYDRKHITLLPTMSGYRDPQDMSLTVTTDYYKVYLRVITEKDLPMGVDDFEIIVPVSEIQSFKLFDPAAFELFEGNAKET